MIDWSRVAGFEWDAGNARKSVDKHGVSQAEAEEAFFNQPLLVLEDDRHSGAEVRFHALLATPTRPGGRTSPLRCAGAIR
jgi:uncharacterized DUF497 family protein